MENPPTKTSQEDEEKPSSKWPYKAWKTLKTLREKNPLIQCITNYVSMDIIANTLLSAGASPAMVSSSLENPDFTPRVDSLYINVGTLSADSLDSMKAAVQVAVENCKPWVLDPVAIGCSGFRLKGCLDLMELRPNVVRGNASEIIALAAPAVTSLGDTKGADSLHESIDALGAAKSLALASGAIVAVSGAVDIVTDGVQVISIHNGVPMMQKITATGCSVTALIAAFVAVDPTNVLEATVSALSIFGIAGELGMETAKGPASLRVNLIDSLYGLDEATVLRRVKVSPLS